MSAITIGGVVPGVSNAVSETKAEASTGCGGCAVKSEGNCTSHLKSAAELIVHFFIHIGKRMVDREHPKHLDVIKKILANDIRDEDGKHVSYEIPTDEKLREWFLDTIAQQVAQELIVNNFVATTRAFDKNNPEHIKIVTGIITKVEDDGKTRPLYEIPSRKTDWFYGVIAQRVTAGLNGAVPAA